MKQVGLRGCHHCLLESESTVTWLQLSQPLNRVCAESGLCSSASIYRTAASRFHPWPGSDQTRDGHRLDWAMIGPDHTLLRLSGCGIWLGPLFAAGTTALAPTANAFVERNSNRSPTAHRRSCGRIPVLWPPPSPDRRCCHVCSPPTLSFASARRSSFAHPSAQPAPSFSLSTHCCGTPAAAESSRGKQADCSEFLDAAAPHQ